MANIIKYFGISPLEGASTILYLVSNDDVSTSSGLYFNKCVPQDTSLISHDELCSKELWDYSEKILSKYL